MKIQPPFLVYSLFKNPLFIYGLVVKLTLILLAFPKTQQDWFLPFLTQTITKPSFDPWAAYLGQDGNILSFPYGIIMYLGYTPLTSVGFILDNLFQIQWLAKCGFGLTSLTFDLGILLGLAQLLKDFPQKLLLGIYWCSPLVIYITYWHGQIDVLPIFLLVLGITLLQLDKPIYAGIIIGLAISSKFSVLIALPFILIYLYRNQRFRDYILAINLSVLISITMTVLPFLFSEAFRQMVILTRETIRLYEVRLNYGENLELFLLPIVYIVILYLNWRIERITLDLFFISIGIGFFSVLVLLPPATGWFMWVIPFLTWYQIRARNNYIWLTFLFFGLCVGYNLLYATGAQVPLFNLDFSQPLANNNFFANSHLHSLSFTLLNSVVLILCIRMYIFGIQRNNYYQSTRRPFSIGISGDSGAGKDTLVIALNHILGYNAVTHISGDDYHKWERNNPMWNTKTHLNPHANNLARLVNDLSLLLDGQSIVKQSYDHQKGKFTSLLPVKPKDFIIVSGLHSLYLKLLREKFNLKIFLDTDDQLQIFWKIRRDMGQRGYSQESLTSIITERKIDSQKFIQSQKQYADLILKLSPVSSLELNDFQREPRLQLSIQMNNGLFHEGLVRHLIAICGMQVEMEQSEDLESVKLLIEGDASAEDIEVIANLLIPNLEDLTSRKPLWNSNYIGIMQVTIIAHIAQILHHKIY